MQSLPVEALDLRPVARTDQQAMNPKEIAGGERPAHAASATYYPYFDWLRAVLAITVMLGHDRVIPWVSSGDLAVKVFFALSGWLIGGMLLHTNREGLPRFFFNRAVRIWAPYYLALILLVGASLLREPMVWKWLEFVFYKLTFVYNWFGTSQLAMSADSMPLHGTGNHFWSVNAEEQFYLLAPLLLVLLPARLGRSAVLWGVLAFAAWLDGHYASIVIGVAAAVLASRYPGIFAGFRARLILGAVAAVAVAGLVVGYRYELVAPILAICVVLLLAIEGPRRPLGAIAGGMSYPLYLNHWIGVFVANALLKPFGMRGSDAGHVLSSSLNIAIAVALYWYIDRRLLQQRSNWYTSQRGRSVTRTAYVMVALGMSVGATLLVQRLA